MQKVCKKICWLGSSVGRKQLIGVSGLGLSLFVLIHMAGNMLILASPEAYNKYSHALVTNPLIYAAEVGLVLLFLAHL
jgi:succinate dehydrogenase / fumarate reductase cytochrome b subunit